MEEKKKNAAQRHGHNSRAYGKRARLSFRERLVLQFIISGVILVAILAVSMVDRSGGFSGGVSALLTRSLGKNDALAVLRSAKDMSDSFVNILGGDAPSPTEEDYDGIPHFVGTDGAPESAPEVVKIYDDSFEDRNFRIDEDILDGMR